MIFVNQKPKLTPVAVKLVGKEWINVSWKNDHMVSRNKGEPGTCYIVEGNYPSGVVPKAIYASTQIQGNDRMLNIGAMGIASTECQAIVNAKAKLRKKLAEAAKGMKHTVEFGPWGYRVIMKETGSRMYGQGSTLDAALANLQMNINIVETTALAAEKADAAYKLVDAPPPKKWKWYHWFWNPEGEK